MLSNSCGYSSLQNATNAYSYSFVSPFMVVKYDDQLSRNKLSEKNYTQGCKWSYDGSCFLVATSDKRLRLFKLPSNVATGQFSDEEWIMEGWKKDVEPSKTVKEAEYIYDYQWHSVLECSEYDSLSFAVACKDLPVHILDSKTGHIICNYLYFNHVDEHTSAYSVNFTNDKMSLICGYFKRIQVFDVNRPGRLSTSVDCKEQPGIISTIAAHPLLKNVFAAGSYSNSVGIYSLETNRAMMILNGHARGITHAQFSHDGTKLFSGTRKDDDIICWDIRNPGNVLSLFKRDPATNQRIYFDITPDDKYLISGSTSGCVLIWDIENSLKSEDCDGVACTSSFPAHKDCANGVSVNPNYPVLATSSGQRYVAKIQDSSCSENGEQEISKQQQNELSVKLWWVCGTPDNDLIR